MRKQFCNIGLPHLGDPDHLFSPENLLEFEDILFEEFKMKWLNLIYCTVLHEGRGQNKLRTYRRFKSIYETEKYVESILPRAHRSALEHFDQQFCKTSVKRTPLKILGSILKWFFFMVKKFQKTFIEFFKTIIIIIIIIIIPSAYIARFYSKRFTILNIITQTADLFTQVPFQLPGSIQQASGILERIALPFAKHSQCHPILLAQ